MFIFSILYRKSCWLLRTYSKILNTVKLICRPANPVQMLLYGCAGVFGIDLLCGVARDVWGRRGGLSWLRLGAVELFAAKQAHVRHQWYLCAAVRAAFELLLGIGLEPLPVSIVEEGVDYLYVDAFLQCRLHDYLPLLEGEYSVAEGEVGEVGDMF